MGIYVGVYQISGVSLYGADFERPPDGFPGDNYVKQYVPEIQIAGDVCTADFDAIVLDDLKPKPVRFTQPTYVKVESAKLTH
jgi:hypothetical protein